MAERIDDIGFGGFRLIQDTSSFCYGVDAVLLADFCRLQRCDRVAELGCGNGVIPLIIEAKYSPASIVGFELQKCAAQLASRNVELNGLSGKISVINDDILNVSAHFPPESFDAVVCNPPYFEQGSGPANADSSKFLARYESSACLSDFFTAASYLLRSNGKFYMIHRPSRLVDILSLTRESGLEAKQLRPVAAKPGCAVNMLLISFVKGGKPELSVLPELDIRDTEGNYTPELQRIYGRA
ncbi:MAG: tRNA1(Val) (adenine(37)-N6)-methyltransferase [Firmicutes bacterium]|nr:tRNA1(Val) (adenine(37)-N6)-methyltransferase [Bacillota bacterium]